MARQSSARSAGNPFNCPKNRDGDPIVQLTGEQKKDIRNIVRSDDCELFLHYLNFIASSYAFWAFGLKISQKQFERGGRRTIRHARYGRGRPKDYMRLRMARCVATAYRETFQKKPSPWDNTRFNKIMAIVFDAAGCKTGDRERRVILKAATSE